jgi:geranyl-CoA carboxylase beta subunit
LLDDGVIDPRDTRPVLAFVLAIIAQAQSHPSRPIQFGVPRF